MGARHLNFAIAANIERLNFTLIGIYGRIYFPNTLKSSVVIHKYKRIYK